MTTNPKPQTPADELAQLRSQVRLMAIAIQRGNDRAEAQQVILRQLETRVQVLENLARGSNEQN